jgi:hypothetical protein
VREGDDVGFIRRAVAVGVTRHRLRAKRKRRGGDGCHQHGTRRE